MRVLRFVPVVVLAFSSVMAMAGVANASPWPFGSFYNCTGGDVPPGTYAAMTITGVCKMPAGAVVVNGNLTVAPGALLDAVTPGDGLALPTPPALDLAAPGTPLVPATLSVGGSVFVGPGAVLAIGCSPNTSCPEAVSYDTIGGSLIATDALGVVVHSARIGGNFSLLGGGGGPSVVDGVASDACLGSPPFSGSGFPDPAPWSEDQSLGEAGIPVYSDAEDNSIGGNLTIVGLQSCYLGAFRNLVGGTETIAANTMGDADANEIAENVVKQNLTCLANTPAVQFGDSGAAPNVVGGAALGECGFGVVLPNPAPEAIESHQSAGPSIPENISVSNWSLQNSAGVHTQTASIAQLELATTESGDTLYGEINSDTLSGSGLTGTIAEQVLETTLPDGNSSFTAFDSCSPCWFDGQMGAASIEAYGTTSADGLTTGTFLITSGGGGYGLGGLDTLAGWGTFSSVGQPENSLSVSEHLELAG